MPLRLLRQMVLLLAIVNMGVIRHVDQAVAAENGKPLAVVALGDSLTAGFGVGPAESFPAQLERLLKGAGHNVTIANAGVSGDTTAGGLARLDWSVPEGTEAVILELGANDMLGGQPHTRARANLEAIIVRLKARGIPVLLAGMRASRSLGDDYANAFDRIFPELAEAHGLILYPFFLAGVALDQKLNQPDGLHPTAAGIGVIAARMVPTVEALLARVKERRVAAPKG